MLVTIAAVPPKLILVGLIISDSLACPTPRFREKYGAKDVKKYYAKFDAAVCLRRCDGPRDPCRSPAGTGRATTGLWQVSSSCRSYVGGKPDCLRRFGVKLKNVRAARSTSVEAFRLRSPQARLPPAKDRAGFGEGVLQSTRQPTTVSFREPHPGTTLRQATLHNYIRKLMLTSDEFMELLKEC